MNLRENQKEVEARAKAMFVLKQQRIKKSSKDKIKAKRRKRIIECKTFIEEFNKVSESQNNNFYQYLVSISSRVRFWNANFMLFEIDKSESIFLKHKVKWFIGKKINNIDKQTIEFNNGMTFLEALGEILSD